MVTKTTHRKVSQGETWQGGRQEGEKWEGGGWEGPRWGWEGGRWQGGGWEGQWWQGLWWQGLWWQGGRREGEHEQLGAGFFPLHDSFWAKAPPVFASYQWQQHEYSHYTQSQHTHINTTCNTSSYYLIQNHNTYTSINPASTSSSILPVSRYHNRVTIHLYILLVHLPTSVKMSQYSDKTCI